VEPAVKGGRLVVKDATVSLTVTVQLELNKQLIAGALTLTTLSCAAWTLTAAIQIALNRNKRVFMDILG
jgi:hypothetical protein